MQFFKFKTNYVHLNLRMHFLFYYVDKDKIVFLKHVNFMLSFSTNNNIFKHTCNCYSPPLSSNYHVKLKLEKYAIYVYEKEVLSK